MRTETRKASCGTYGAMYLFCDLFYDAVGIRSSVGLNGKINGKGLATKRSNRCYLLCQNLPGMTEEDHEELHDIWRSDRRPRESPSVQTAACSFNVTCLLVARKEHVCSLSDTVPSNLTCGVAPVRVNENPL
jgi:hypothetical protein